MGIESLLLSLAPSVINGLFGLANTWIGGQTGNTSGAMSQSGMTNQTGTSNSTTTNNGTTNTSGNETTTGNTAGIAGALEKALGTPTGNNSQIAADFGQGSATTANNLQQNDWIASNLLSLGSNLLSNAMSAASTASARRYNSAEAEKQRAWQENMSNTSYQRGVKDLQAAGLNPILAAYNGYGAGSAPSGGYGSVAGGQTFQQANIASTPSMHTATMQAMYDYGNNTAQFLDNAMRTINNARQTKNWQQASVMQNIMESVGSSSAKTVQELTQKTSSHTDTQKSTGLTKPSKQSNPSNNTSGRTSGGMGGGQTHGSGGGRKR